MRKANSPPGTRHILFFFLTALLVLAVDQLTKTWIRSNLVLGESLPVTDWLRLTYAHNSGSAFGLFPNQSLLLTIVSLLGIVLIVVTALFAHHWLPLLNNGWSRVALGLILGGVMGNVTDRIYLGYVTDFVDFGFWPAFNTADSAIICGSLIIAYTLLTFPLTENNRPIDRRQQNKPFNR